MFSESTCSGVSEISNLFLVHELLGYQVPQHDVSCALNDGCGRIAVVAKSFLSLYDFEVIYV
jgi:hypothetical protein